MYIWIILNEVDLLILKHLPRKKRIIWQESSTASTPIFHEIHALWNFCTKLLRVSIVILWLMINNCILLSVTTMLWWHPTSIKWYWNNFTLYEREYYVRWWGLHNHMSHLYVMVEEMCDISMMVNRSPLYV